MAILMELDKKKPIKMAGGWLELNERDDSLSHMIRMIFFLFRNWDVEGLRCNA